MTKEEFLKKTEDVFDLYKTDASTLDDSVNHIFVLAAKYAKYKFGQYQENLFAQLDNVNVADAAAKQELIFGIKKALFPDFD